MQVYGPSESLIWSEKGEYTKITSSHSEMFGALISLLLVDMRILTSRGPVSLSDGQDSFLCCYLPSKITRLPAQYPLLFPPRGKQAARGPYVRLSGCISISRPSLIIEMN